MPFQWDSIGCALHLIIRVQAFASRNPVLRSLVDGAGMGLAFTVTLGALGAIREILGNGSVFGYTVLGSNYTDMLVMVLPPGAFLAIGIMLGVFNTLDRG